MPWYAILMIGVIALGAGVTLAQIDQPRRPITTGLALWTLVADALFIWGIVSLVS